MLYQTFLLCSTSNISAISCTDYKVSLTLDCAVSWPGEEECRATGDEQWKMSVNSVVFCRLLWEDKQCHCMVSVWGEGRGLSYSEPCPLPF